MIACVDVHYQDGVIITAALVFLDWNSNQPIAQYVDAAPESNDRETGSFFTRELSPILGVLKSIKEPLHAVIINGYVWLNENSGMGLGAHLYENLDKKVPIIGVARTKFKGAPYIEISRGGSKSPLYVTTAGIDAQVAADKIKRMHGEFRIPTMLRKVDHLSKGIKE